ncbi:two pore calcium channel protein 1B [Capsicum galapagoense]
MEESLLPVSSLECRSDAVIAKGSLYHKAAAFVDLADDGAGIPEEILEGSNFEKAAPLYFMFNYVHLIGKFNSILLVILNFFEKPLWCFKHLAESCNNRDYYFLGELPYLTSTQSIIYEVVTLLILVIHILFPISFEGFHLYWKRNLNKLKVILLLILAADIVVYMLFLSNFSYLPFRIAPYLRVVFLILNNRELREIFLILAGMFGAYLNVVALSALYLLFSSWLGYVFFTDTRLGKTTFTSYGTTLYQMFLLFTASNHPDVWIPAYKDARWYCLFFILYVIVSIYVVVNLILAGIYGSFVSELKKKVAEKDEMRRRILNKVFYLIDNTKSGYVDKEQCFFLFKELNKYRTIPEIPRDDFELIFNELDVTHDFKINLDEFDRLCNIIALKFEEEDSLSIFEKCPNFYHSPASEKLRGFIRSTKFENIIVFVLLVNLVAVIIETMLDMQDNSAQTLWQKIEISFGWLYVIEMALKVYTYGFGNYWRDGKNQFDFCITCFIVIEEMTILVDLDALNALSNRNWIRYLLITRMLRFVRLLIHIRRFRAFVATFLRLMYSLLPYWGTVFCIICIYCSLGLQIFGGIVNSGNPNLNQTALASYDYLLFNFNDYPNGMVTLFNLLVMGIWPPVMQSYKELTGTSWTYGYFFSFYLIAALWLLNLIMVFVLEAFRVENEDIEPSARRMDDEDKDERSEQRRTVGTKNRRQKLDDLHRRMVRERT